MNWLCSYNELMNNCWRAAAAITARSSVCRASLQDLCSVPQLSPQATTTQTAWVAPIQPPSLPPAYFSVHLVPHFSSDPSLLFLNPPKTQTFIMSAHVVGEPHLSDFPGSFVCICLALTLSQRNKKKKGLRWSLRHKIKCAWIQTCEVHDENKQPDPISRTVACLLCILNHLDNQLLKWTSVGPAEAEPELHSLDRS